MLTRHRLSPDLGPALPSITGRGHSSQHPHTPMIVTEKRDGVEASQATSRTRPFALTGMIKMGGLGVHQRTATTRDHAVLITQPIVEVP